MTDTVTFFDTPTAEFNSNTVEFFDPPMCCPTGLCGPTLDQTLLDVNEMVLALKAKGVRIERYQMTGHPNKFLSNPDVMRLVQEKQADALPITIVQGRVLKVGAYPSLAEVTTALNNANTSANGDPS